MDEVPVSMAIAQAAKETGWGTSRFAQEGNALFGQWTWSGEGIKPAKADSNATHKIMKFKISRIQGANGILPLPRLEVKFQGGEKKLDLRTLLDFPIGN